MDPEGEGARAGPALGPSRSSRVSSSTSGAPPRAFSAVSRTAWRASAASSRVRTCVPPPAAAAYDWMGCRASCRAHAERRVHLESNRPETDSEESQT